MGLVSTPQVFVWTVLPNPIVIYPTTLANPQTDMPYSQQILATGGDGGPYTFSVSSGALPPGLTLSPAGLITGTTSGGAILGPTSWPNGLVDVFYSEQLAITETGVGASYAFNVRATDLSGSVATRAYTLTVESGWTTPLYGLVVGGVAPKCLTVYSTGLIRGYPMTVGTFAFPVQAQHLLGLTVTLTITLTVTS